MLIAFALVDLLLINFDADCFSRCVVSIVSSRQSAASRAPFALAAHAAIVDTPTNDRSALVHFPAPPSGRPSVSHTFHPSARLSASNSQ
jgi:hypothetical protein